MWGLGRFEPVAVNFGVYRIVGAIDIGSPDLFHGKADA
jgi:hypothetical protein